jgi:SNF2 family DNA or RNA helicase
MFVLHSHWQPPRHPAGAGGVFFWAETSEAPAPQRVRGQLSRKYKPRPHPYILPPEKLRELIGAGTPLGEAKSGQFGLMLPSTRTGPMPSPELNHSWELDWETPPFLSPWTINGLFLPSGKAFSVLINLPVENLTAGFVLGQDSRYWQVAANLVLETLASQKMVPVLVQGKENGRHFYARWMPVLDGSKDAARLDTLTTSMPTVCRAETPLNTQLLDRPRDNSAHFLLDSFLRLQVDALVRAWAKSRTPLFAADEDGPTERWLLALFQEDATVKAFPAQMQAFSSSLRAWLRNLHAAGDGNFRIAFRLIAPDPRVGSSEDETWKLEYLVQSRNDPSLLIDVDEFWNNSATAFVALGKKFDRPGEKILTGLGYAARLCPSLLPSLQTSHPNGHQFNTSEAYHFLRESVPLLSQAGFGVLSPPWWNQRGARLGVRLRVQPKEEMNSVSGLNGKLGFDRLVNYSWELSLGGTRLTHEEFTALAALKAPLLKIRGQWVQLDDEQIEAAIRFWEKEEHSGEITLLQAAQYSLGGQEKEQGLPLEEVVMEGWLEDWLVRLSNPSRIVELPQPAGIKGVLRPYQRYGFSWMSFFRGCGLGAILADDMGLGKTIQALALLVNEKDERGSLPAPVLLVCPTSVVANWEHEVRRFAPSLKTLVHQGAARRKNGEFLAAAGDVDMVLSSYAVVRQDAEFIQKMNWWGVILDEAQNIKNPATKMAQAVRKMNSEFRFALTGTPVENRLTELWSIMQFLNPGFLGKQETFRRDIALPIERFGDQEATQKLRGLVSPFILRRVKTDPSVIQDLPEKIEMKEYCTLTEEQATLYQAVVQDVMSKVQEKDGIERKGMVLSLLMQLKQICNHPAQYLKQVDADGLNLSVLDFRSGKLNRLVEMLEEILEVGDRVLIFTQFAEMGKLLAGHLPQSLGKSVQFLHGGTPVKTREQMVNRFQDDEHAPPIFILSLKAGGTGLNLTRANHVFHFDRWWNPAVEDQATDRAFRIGQVRNVQVHKFVTQGTLEERIDEMIESKKGLAQSIIGAGEHWLTELSTDDLRDLVALRV